MNNKVCYCKGYKYQLREDFICQTNIFPKEDITTELVFLNRFGELIIRKYFAWDGCSGPTWDDSTNMRAGLVHDALYYLMRMGLLSIDWRLKVDEELSRLMIEDGAWEIRAKYYELAVKTFAESCATEKNKRKVYIAPK